MKILIIGARGMLAREVITVFEGGHELAAYDHPEIDICDAESIARIVDRYQPQWVINCAAYTNVDGCETDQEQAFAVNGDGPGNLARACRERGLRLCHISTDFVFDGTKGSPYVETDAVNPLSVYGKSKLAGERQVQEVFDDYLIVRTSWLFGHGGNNFIKTICKLAAGREELTVVSDQKGSPTGAVDLARMLKAAVENDLRGLYHMCNSGVCSWFDLALKAVALAGCGTRVVPVTTEQFVRPATRPAFSAMDCTKIMRDTGLTIRHWSEALQEYFQGM